MEKPYLLSFAMLCAALLSSCVSGKADMERILAAMDQQDSREHEKIMRSFIEKAQKDDVDGMIALTSKITIKQIGGEEKERALYRGDTIPALKIFRTIAPGGESTFGADNAGHYGWKFKRTFVADDGRTANLQFTILREDVALIIAYFGLWEKG
jgi:hypothetical protein